MNKTKARLFAAFLTVQAMSLQAYAAGEIESTKLFTGTVNLLNDVTKALMVIAPLLGAATIGIFAVIKMNAEENEQPMWKKRMVGVGIGVIIVFVASGVITAITSYYK